MMQDAKIMLMDILGCQMEDIEELLNTNINMSDFFDDNLNWISPSYGEILAGTFEQFKCHYGLSKEDIDIKYNPLRIYVSKNLDSQIKAEFEHLFNMQAEEINEEMIGQYE